MEQSNETSLTDPEMDALVKLMSERTLSSGETIMIVKRHRMYQLRKIVEKIVYSLPGILLSVARMMGS